MPDQGIQVGEQRRLESGKESSLPGLSDTPLPLNLTSTGQSSLLGRQETKLVLGIRDPGRRWGLRSENPLAPGLAFQGQSCRKATVNDAQNQRCSSIASPTPGSKSPLPTSPTSECKGTIIKKLWKFFEYMGK